MSQRHATVTHLHSAIAWNDINLKSPTFTITAFLPAKRPPKTRTTFPDFINLPMAAKIWKTNKEYWLWRKICELNSRSNDNSMCTVLKISAYRVVAVTLNQWIFKNIKMWNRSCSDTVNLTSIYSFTALLL